MNLTVVLFTTLLMIVTTKSQTCTPIQGCDVTINDQCYAHVDDNLSWNQAEDCCVAWGGHLASIHSAGVNMLLNDIRNQDRFTWIGLSDTANNGVYVWTDGTAYNYENYAPNQPDGLGGESCFHLFNQARGSLLWNDYYCSRNTWGSVLTSYICQRAIVPYLDKSRCDITQNGKCYISVDTAITWQRSEDSCVEWGGHLASIHSDVENYAVNSIRDKKTNTWIGLNDIANDGVYVWTDDTPFDYNNFAPEEPNNWNGGESCCRLFNERRGELEWNDGKCDEHTWGETLQTSFVCKKEHVIPTLKGEPGEPGSNGLNGVEGRDGRDGLRGANGDKGERGLTGSTGPQGINGPIGEAGINGIDGQSGTDGLKGEPGIYGAIGEPGTNGGKGDKGERGDRGFPGVYAQSKGTHEPVGSQD